VILWSAKGKSARYTLDFLEYNIMQGDLITIAAMPTWPNNHFSFLGQYYVKWEFNTESFFVGTLRCA